MSGKRMYQPKKLPRLRALGFRARMSTPGGKNVVKRRRNKKRKRLTVSEEFRIQRKKPRAKAR